MTNATSGRGCFCPIKRLLIKCTLARIKWHTGPASKPAICRLGMTSGHQRGSALLLPPLPLPLLFPPRPLPRLFPPLPLPLQILLLLPQGAVYTTTRVSQRSHTPGAPAPRVTPCHWGHQNPRLCRCLQLLVQQQQQQQQHTVHHPRCWNAHGVPCAPCRWWPNCRVCSNKSLLCGPHVRHMPHTPITQTLCGLVAC